MEYISKCCHAIATFVEKFNCYRCSECGAECGIVDPADVEPVTE
jgi:hypothetical protein